VPDLWTDLLGCLDLHIEDGACGFTGPHRPWLLLRQHSPVLAHGRCFGRGDVLTEDGALVASYAQEALLRFRDADESVDT
jgi:acyl-CoA thioesterase